MTQWIENKVGQPGKYRATMSITEQYSKLTKEEVVWKNNSEQFSARKC